MGRLNESCGPLAVGDEVLDDAFDRTWDEVSAELGSISGDEDPVTPAIAPEPGAVLNQILDQLAAQGEILERIVRDSRPRPRRYEEASLESRPAPRPVSTDHSWLEIGLGVEHPVFGHGKIVDISGQGDKTEVTIDFVGVGVKHLAATWAPLQPSTSGSEDAAGTDP
jgi:hypothetical protein